MSRTKRIEKVHISKIKRGDTVIHNGKEVTVGLRDIRDCSFMGLSLFGDTYKLGTKLIQRVIYE